jgi:hypothetical protein
MEPENSLPSSQELATGHMHIIHVLTPCFFKIDFNIISCREFDSGGGGAWNFSLHHRLQNLTGAHQPPIQWVPESLPLWVKWPRRGTDHSPPSSAEVNESVELYIHSSNTPSWHGAQLKKAQGQLYLFPLSSHVGL